MIAKQRLKQADGVPDYHVAPRYDGEGAAALVYNQEFGLPPYLFRGAGRCAGALAVLQPAQAMYPLSIATAGLGGTQAGFLVGTPLSSLTGEE